MKANATLATLGEQIQTLIGEVREMRSKLSVMRLEIDRAFHMMRDIDSKVEGLRRVVDSHGQSLTALERGMRPKPGDRGKLMLSGDSV